MKHKTFTVLDIGWIYDA